MVPSGARHPGLARPRAEADDDRREAAAAQHHQTWEHLPAHAADPRSACGTAEPLQTGDTLGLVASRSSVPSAPQRGHCRARGEARSYSVGNAAAWCTLRAGKGHGDDRLSRSEEHTSELQSLMSISYAVFCLKKKKQAH